MLISALPDKRSIQGESKRSGEEKPRLLEMTGNVMKRQPCQGGSGQATAFSISIGQAGITLEQIFKLLRIAPRSSSWQGARCYGVQLEKINLMMTHHPRAIA
jgi:hypothetical protein